MTYEKRGGMVSTDFFASLSTGESDQFLAEYNAARNDSERSGVIRRWMGGRATQVRNSKPVSDPNEARMAALRKKYHPKVDTELTLTEIENAARYRQLMGKRDWS